MSESSPQQGAHGGNPGAQGSGNTGAQRRDNTGPLQLGPDLQHVLTSCTQANMGSFSPHVLLTSYTPPYRADGGRPCATAGADDITGNVCPPTPDPRLHVQKSCTQANVNSFSPHVLSHLVCASIPC